MAVIAVFNQKGGVGKTTTCLNLLGGIRRQGGTPLGIDLDPQTHLSGIMGWTALRAEQSMFAFFTQNRPLRQLIQQSAEGFVGIPAHLETTKLDTMLGKGFNIVNRLNHALHEQPLPYGPVVIDCCPLLGVLSLNAIFACDMVVVPVSADYLALKGAAQVDRMLRALEPVFKRRITRRYLLTRFDRRRKMSFDIADRLVEMMGPDDVCTTRIVENVALAESPARNLDVFSYAPQAQGAKDYAALIEELGIAAAPPEAPATAVPEAVPLPVGGERADDGERATVRVLQGDRASL